MAVKTHALFYKRDDGEETNICVQIVHFFCWVLYLGITFAALYFRNKANCIDYHETNALQNAVLYKICR